MLLYPHDGQVDVSIVLICWNSLELTAAAIRTVQNHTHGVRYEVIVVDNGSTKDAVPTELARRFPEIRIIANPDNLGFAKANNQGIEVARGRYVLLLNSDTEQTENAVGRAVEYMDANPDVGVLGILHRNGDPGRTYQLSARSFPTPLDSARRIVQGLFTNRQLPLPTKPPSEGDVDVVTGSFLLVRRNCLDQVGRLDERFFVYAEDIDLCFQVRKAGWRVRFWPGVSLVHFGSSSASQVADKTFMIYRNELEFFRKNHFFLAVFVFYAVMSVRLGLSTVYQAIRCVGGRARGEVVRERWDRLWNFLTIQSDRRGLNRG